jgi:LEA14-like dessication related protein
MKKINLFLSVALVLLCCNACMTYKDIRATDIKSIKPLSVTFTSVKIQIELGIENPNNYAISLKKQNVRAYINGNDVGEIRIEEQLRLPKKSNQIYTLTLVPDAAKVVSALPSIMIMGNVEAQLKGSIKIKAGYLPKTIAVDLKKKVSLDDFQF